MKSKQTLADDNRSVSVITSLKIHGQPWSQAVYNSGKASVQARLILLEVIKIFSEHNWRLACNVNLESTADSLGKIEKDNYFTTLIPTLKKL